MSLAMKICGVVLLVILPMAFGLTVSAALSFVMRKLTKQDRSA